MARVLRILFPEKKSEIETIILELASRLRETLGANLVSVESFEGAEGENVKVIVRKKTQETVDKIMEEIWRLEVEKNIEGKLLPEIVSIQNEIHTVFISHETKLSEEILEELSIRLKRVLGTNFVSIESFEGAEGENVKVIVRKKTQETVDKIMEEIWRLEVEKDIEGRILPEVEELI